MAAVRAEFAMGSADPETGEAHTLPASWIEEIILDVVFERHALWC